MSKNKKKYLTDDEGIQYYIPNNKKPQNLWFLFFKTFYAANAI